MKTFYPWDARKIDKEKREPLKELWDSLTEDEKNLVNLLMEQAVNEFSGEYR